MAFTSTLREKIVRTSDTVSYRFDKPADYHFAAGQSFSITIPAANGPLVHQFSHADSPAEPFIELTTRLTGSEFKNALDALPLGAAAEIKGPYGSFVFAYDAPRIAFLTGGIGITPVRSMLRHLVDTEGKGRAPGQELVLFYGSMTEDGIIYASELAQFEQQIENLRVIHVITNPGALWPGYKGFITAEIITAELDIPSGWLYYLVGPPPMVTAMDKILSDLEIPAEQRVVERFTGYPS